MRLPDHGRRVREYAYHTARPEDHAMPRDRGVGRDAFDPESSRCDQRHRADRRRIDHVDGLHLRRSRAAYLGPAHERLRRNPEGLANLCPPITAIAPRDHPRADPRPQLRRISRFTSPLEYLQRARKLAEFAILLHRVADESTSRGSRQDGSRRGVTFKRGPLPDHRRPRCDAVCDCSRADVARRYYTCGAPVTTGVPAPAPSQGVNPAAPNCQLLWGNIAIRLSLVKHTIVPLE